MSNSASELAYTVVGATTGQIIPALPGAVPADAPAYVDGSTISFSGVEIAINGTPQVGDDFQVVPSGGETLFSTVQNIITALSSPDSTLKQQAAI